jgi:hypothetical protein
MSLTTIDTRAWHARYAALEALAAEETARGEVEPVNNITDAVEAAWDAVHAAFEKYGFKAANDDRAEELIATLTCYLFGSNRDLELLKHVSLLIDAKVLR